MYHQHMNLLETNHFSGPHIGENQIQIEKELIVGTDFYWGESALGTVISGDGMQGTIVSTNLNADSGSQLLLDDGSMKMGGTTSLRCDVTSRWVRNGNKLSRKI